MTGILMQQSTGTTAEFIPHRGAGPAMQAMLGGQVDLMVVQAAVTLPQARAGTVKILANLSPARSSVVPNIPTSEESGIPGLRLGMVRPVRSAGHAEGDRREVNAALVHALAQPAVRTRFSDLGLDVASREQQSPEGLAAFHKGEVEKWWPIIKAAGIKVESSRRFSLASVPPRPAARRRKLSSPRPREGPGSLKPTPSSATWIRSQPASACALTVTALACE